MGQGGGGGSNAVDDDSGNPPDMSQVCANGACDSSMPDLGLDNPVMPDPASEACITGALGEVLAAGETAGAPNDGYGTNYAGTVAISPQFPQYVGQRNVQLTNDQLANLIDNPQFYVPIGNNSYSSAFGRYQINYMTAQEYNVTDWTPSGQDDAAAAMLRDTGAVSDAMQGNLQQAFWDMGGWPTLLRLFSVCAIYTAGAPS